jgi:hypothetical protein
MERGLDAAVQKALSDSAAGAAGTVTGATLGVQAGVNFGDILSKPTTLNSGTSGGGGGGGGAGGSGSVPPALTVDNQRKLMGQQLWKYPIKLFNHLRDFDIPAHAITRLVIEDDFLTWPLRGYVVVDSKLEGFERSIDPSASYFIRSDARDEIKIQLFPEVEKGTLPDNIWKIEVDAVIYDVEDIYTPNLTGKLKKLYFWDKKFQHLIEKNIQWSTATGKRFVSPAIPKPIAHATDAQRSMFTGEAIASLLSEVGYEDHIDFDNWNWGEGKILFTSKTGWTIAECIEYIMAQQISDDGKYDLCVLQWNRMINKWNLTPMWRLFELAGDKAPKELQLEHMFIEENIAEDPPAASPYKAPHDPNPSVTVDIKSDEYNKIRTYKFSQTSGLDNAKAFVSKPVYSHWHRKKQFDTDAKENEIKYVKEKYFKKNYVDFLLSPAKYPVMAMNLTKTLQKSIDPQFSAVSTLEPKNDRSIRSMDGRGKIMYAGLFLNQNMVITQTGSTHRHSGTFVGVDRMTTNSDTIYDWQVCGQYFVTNVKHIIQHQKYNNELTMVKVHAYQALPVNEGVV